MRMREAKAGEERDALAFYHGLIDPTTGTIPFSMYELALGDGSGAGRTLRDGRERR